MSKLPHCLSILVLFFLNKRQIKIGKLISVQTNCLWACSLLLQLFLCFNTSRLQAFSACKPHAQQFVNALKSSCLNVRSLKLIFLITYNTIQYTTRLGFHSCDFYMYLGRSKGLCSSYLFTVHNTEVYMYLSDRKVSFVNSEIFCVNFCIGKKKANLTHKCSKQLGY